VTVERLRARRTAPPGRPCTRACRRPPCATGWGADGDVEDAANLGTTDEQDAAGDPVSEFLVDECGIADDSFLGTNG